VALPFWYTEDGMDNPSGDQREYDVDMHLPLYPGVSWLNNECPNIPFSSPPPLSLPPSSQSLNLPITEAAVAFAALRCHCGKEYCFVTRQALEKLAALDIISRFTGLHLAPRMGVSRSATQ